MFCGDQPVDIPFAFATYQGKKRLYETRRSKHNIVINNSSLQVARHSSFPLFITDSKITGKTYKGTSNLNNNSTK